VIYGDPQDIPNAFMRSSHTAVTGVPAADYSSSLIVNLKQAVRQHNTRNTQLPSPQPPPTASSHTNLVPIKGFVHEALRQSRTSGSVLQTALCYLEAICVKVPELVKKEKTGYRGNRIYLVRLSRGISMQKNGNKRCHLTRYG
jgi:PHO85 cyclin-5